VGSMARELEQLVDTLRAFFDSREEVDEAYLYGSQVREQAGPLSDIDVAVHVEPARQAEACFGYQAELGAALMSLLGTNRVDVVLLDRAPPLLYHRVLRDGIRLMARSPRATTTREGRALSRWCDYSLQLKKLEEAARCRLQRREFGR